MKPPLFQSQPDKDIHILSLHSKGRGAQRQQDTFQWESEAWTGIRHPGDPSRRESEGAQQHSRIHIREELQLAGEDLR